ncbi:hypothetical protein DPMN_086598 [Dreissena polymorpha]|uniref:Uncharacterized protein n=1 Tax=Dreissena polymorpha TaxID=45954 RepID=A0A9D4KQQ4_DREPO|nr:hypothetical protein DPMN_086598 [Dreissena polymorpha]
MYGNARTDLVDKLRFPKIKEVCDDSPNASKNEDLSVLPPCKQCLLQHIRRVNYQVGIWKRSLIPDPDKPLASEGHGWTKHTDTGLIEPLWIDGDILSPQIVDVLEDMANELEEDNDTDESDTETERVGYKDS